MSKNFLIYFVLFNSIQFLLIEINCQMAPFKPLQRYLHSATFIDNKLYILGGRDTSDTTMKVVGKGFFYLDFSVQFNTQELLWQDLTSTNVVPPHRGAVAVRSSVNNRTLFLYGGVSIGDMACVYTFDPRSNSWSIPKASGDTSTIMKSYLTGVIETNGKMYLFSGQEALGNNTVNDMLILDTINISWEKGSLVSAPTPRAFYGATLISNHKIIYMGGVNSVDGLALNEVYIYNTINDNWIVKITSGNIPSGRGRFTAVLGLDGQRVIIYGGYSSGSDLKPEEALYVLDLTNYSWYIPKIYGKIPKSRYWHQANIIGKYMVISFGIANSTLIEDDILLLDISNNNEYIWTTLFQPSVSNSKTPQSPSSPLSPSPDTSPNNTPAMIGAIIGSLFGGILLSFGGFFLLYKWNKNKQRQKSAIETTGNDNYNNYYNQEKMLPEINVNRYFSNGQEVIYDNRFINYENNKSEDLEINDGQEIILANNNRGSSVQNIDSGVIRHLKNEMIQAVKQEINSQFSNLNNTNSNHGQE